MRVNAGSAEGAYAQPAWGNAPGFKGSNGSALKVQFIAGTNAIDFEAALSALVAYVDLKSWGCAPG